MKIRNLIQVILITLAIHSVGFSDSKDKTLWGGAEYGMTPAQVLKVFPDAQRNPKPETVALSLSQSHVIIPSRRINGAEYEVTFYFNTNGLAQVTLLSEYASRLNSNSIESILREKYGEPVKVKDNKVVRDVEWYIEPLSVSILYIGDPDIPTLRIYYTRSRYDAMNSL